MGRGFLTSVTRAGFVRLLGLLANYSFFVIAGNLFGPAVLGRFSIAMIILMLASTISIHGLNTALVRFSSGDIAKGDPQAARHRLVWVTRRVTIIAFVVSLCILGFTYLAAFMLFLDPLMAVPIGVLGASLVPFTLIQLAAGYAQGLGRVGLQMALSYLLVPTFSTLLLTLLYMSWGNEYSLVTAYAIGVLATSVIAYAVFFLKGSFKGLSRHVGHKEMLVSCISTIVV